MVENVLEEMCHRVLLAHILFIYLYKNYFILLAHKILLNLFHIVHRLLV